jgi:hypothetical protein
MCIVIPQTRCQDFGGVYGGDGTNCKGATCQAQPSGACCFPSGFCFVTTQDFCTGHQGTYRGDGTTCAASTCPPATGACCVPNTGCVVVTAAACAMQNGTYHGNNVPCSATLCGGLVSSGTGGGISTIESGRNLADFNHDGVVNILDAIAFMNAYSAGHADLNGDGVTDARDMALFMQLMGTAR